MSRPETKHQSLLDVVDDAVLRYADRPSFALRRDDGSAETWTYRELGRRTMLVAWRLRRLGLQPGDRLLTWSPSTPALPAVYYGAMRAGVIFVPLDLRMAPDAIEKICQKADARHLALGTGRDAPDPREARLEHFPTTTVDALVAEPDASFPADWEEQVASWPRPGWDDLFEIVFTSGTTGAPKGVMLHHGSQLSNIEAYHRAIPPQEHRIVSLLPLSHLMEQSAVLFYGIDVGANVLFVRSRNPRVIFEAIRDHCVTTMTMVPQLLEVFWSAIEREVERQGRTGTFDRLRRIARHLPYPLRRLLFRQVHGQFGGGLCLFISAAAFLPPALQQAWEDLGVVVMQGYGATECGMATVNTQKDHSLGTVGHTFRPAEVRLAPDGEIQVRGPQMFQGYWHDPEATAAAFTEDRWYRTGDVGRYDENGRLILMGRTKDIIVLPNGLNVYPEDIENELRMAGIHDSVVLESEPGRIEAVVLVPSETPPSEGRDMSLRSSPGPAGDPAGIRAEIEASVKRANAKLAPHQRVVAWRIWPEADFPRTHTLKVKRDQVRRWAAVSEPLQVREEGFGAGAEARPDRAGPEPSAGRVFPRRSRRRP